jgi:hypothetical protein
MLAVSYDIDGMHTVIHSDPKRKNQLVKLVSAGDVVYVNTALVPPVQARRDDNLLENGSNDTIQRAAAQVNAFLGDRSFDQAAYHGSPHIFDRFSLDHIGTGEGVRVRGRRQDNWDNPKLPKLPAGTPNFHRLRTPCAPGKKKGLAISD